MKVLFLDIDGVCNSAEWVRQGNNPWNGVSPELVQRVKRIIEETGCSVVLSSTWRLYPDSLAVVRQKICKVMDVTKDFQGGGKWGVAPRGDEVKDWLDRHPSIKQYAILDDNSDFHADQWLFQTTWERGITEEITQAVIDHLTADTRRYLYAK